MDHQRIFEVKSATKQNFGALWLSNFEANRNRIRNAQGVSALFEKMPGVPALVVGAGPSLDKNLQYLRAAAGKAVIICVDTILKGLVDEGVEPDFVMTLDPQPDIGNFFHGVDTLKKILVAPTIAHPRALEVWRGDVVFYNKYAPDIPQLVKIASEDPNLGYLIPGGSVLTVGLDLAFRMGTNPIGFAGQDLSYLPGAAYSSNTIYAGMEQDEFLREKGDVIVKDKDIFGREVLTQKSLFVTKQWMEWAFTNWKRKQPADFYNLTEGGIVSKSCKVMPLSEWMARFLKEEKNIGWNIKKALRKKRR